MRMRYKLILLPFMLCLTLTAIGQNTSFQQQKIDSLKSVLHTNLSFAQKVSTLIALAKIQGKKMAKDAQKNLTEAKAIAEKSANKRGLADAYLQEGLLLLALKKRQLSQAAFNQALKLYQSLPDTYEQQGDTYYYTGRLLNDRQSPDSTRTLYAKAIEAYTKSKSIEKVAETYVRDGQLLYVKGDYLNSIESIQKGLKIYQDRKKRKREGHAINALGSAYYLKRDYEKALEIYQQSLKIALETKDINSLRSNYNNIGLCYMRLEKLPEALINLREAEKIGIQQKSKGTIAKARNGIGNVYLKLNQLDSALYCYKLAVRLAKEIKSTYIQPFSLNGVTRVFVAMQQPDSALKYGLEALDISRRVANKNTEQDATEQLALIYEMKKDYSSAYQYHKIFKHLSDSLVDEDKIKKITSLENKFAFEKEKEKQKQQQLLNEARLNSDLRQQKFLNSAFLGGFLLVMILAFYVYRSYQIKRKANQVLLEKNSLITQQNEEITQQSEELNNTNNQLVELGNFKEALMGMIVHDLKNPLNVIIGLSESEYKAEYLKMINQSGQRMLTLVMNILDVQKFEASEIELRTEPLSLNKLVNTSLQDVQLLLQQKKLAIDTEINTQDWVIAEEELLIRVFTNLLTNAIKFSLSGGKITITNELVIKPEQEVEFTKVWVKDEGIGIPANKLDLVFTKFGQVHQKKSGGIRSTGLGLTFCKLVVEAHGGQIGVESVEGKGTAFWLTLPLDKNARQANLITEDTKYAQNSPAQSPGESLFDFSPQEKEMLQPILNELGNYEFFEFTKIKATLAQLEEFENENIQALKNQLNTAFLNMNEDNFHQLVESV